MLNHDKFRLEVLKNRASLKSFHESWPVYSSLIKPTLGKSPVGQNIFDLGSHLSGIFTGQVAGRTQSSVSRAGTAWESLVVWYLNLVFWNTPVIATTSVKRFVPNTILNAIDVTIGNRTTNTESDVIVYSIPGLLDDDPSIEKIDKLIMENLKAVDVAVIQCKTNWNDNSQIPMLWDIVYNSYNQAGRPIANVLVGTNGINPSSFNKFTYSFMTVPTTSVPPATAVSVARVSNLSGGNYFGKESMAGIAQSFKEFFGRNFHDYFKAGIPTHIDYNLERDPDYLGRFVELNFTP